MKPGSAIASLTGPKPGLSVPLWPCFVACRPIDQLRAERNVRSPSFTIPTRSSVRLADVAVKPIHPKIVVYMSL